MRTLLLVLLGGLLAGCTQSSKSTPPPEPNLDGLVTIKRGAGSRYIIDVKSRACMLMIDHAITTRVDCGTLKKNVKQAGKHMAWLKDPSPSEPTVTTRPPTPTPTPTATGPRAQFQALMDAGIKKRGAYRYEMNRDVLDAVLASPMRISRGARIVPAIRNGKPNGLKLYALRPGSFYTRIGLNNGDTVMAINQLPIGSGPDKLLDLYQKIKTQSRFVLSISRRGKPVQLSITIVNRKTPVPATPKTTPTVPAPTTRRGVPSSLWVGMNEANKLYDRMDYEGAIKKAKAVLKDDPRNVRMLRVVVSSYCHMGNAAGAKTYYTRLPARDQTHMRLRCRRLNVDPTK